MCTCVPFCWYAAEQLFTIQKGKWQPSEQQRMLADAWDPLTCLLLKPIDGVRGGQVTEVSAEDWSGEGFIEPKTL